MQVGPKVGLKDIIMISHDTCKLKIRAQKLPSLGHSPHGLLKYFLKVSVIMVKRPKDPLDLEGSSCNPTAYSFSTQFLHLLLMNELPQ